jgi:electron transfer flavoprotein beta subunit
VLHGWSQATYAAELSVKGDTAEVTRDVDGGLQTVAVKIPAIVLVDLCLNEPRCASLPNMMTAKAKPFVAKTPPITAWTWHHASLSCRPRNRRAARLA